MLTRQKQERSERSKLAVYAMKSSDSKGRVYREKEHPFRACYQRDRDRIIHSNAFRRLEYKTQVFVNHEGDYYRTRLTHTLEVAQIARSVARALQLNEDLVEAISLAHDLGHTPFGHAGEESLADIMKGHGGFDHNTQGLRVVDCLEEKYPGFPGLNLTFEVREGIIKHTSWYDKARRPVALEPEKSPLLETEVVDIADEIAYDNHDLDDGITSKLLKEHDLERIPLWHMVSRKVKKNYINIKPEIRKYLIIKSLIDIQVTDLLEESEKRLKKYNIKSIKDVRRPRKRIIGFSPKMDKMRVPLRDFLSKNLYRHYRVIRMSDKAKRFIHDLFRVYLAKPEQLPPTSQKRAKKEGPYRAICDYIAGMTDRYFLDEYKKLFDPYTRV